MLKYVSRRIAISLIILVLISATVFIIFNYLPFDPARLSCGKHCTPEIIAGNRHRLGLDVNWWVQWWRFLEGIFVGRNYGEGAALIHCGAPAFGYSFTQHACVTTLLGQALPVTVSLAIGAFIMWLLLGVTLGVISARFRNTWIDRLSTVFVLVGTSLPTFISGLLLLLFVVLKFNLISPLDLGTWHSPLSDPWGWFSSYFWPWLSLALIYAATYTRFTRSNVIETSSEDFIRTARAKGVSERKVLWKHTLRPALAPILTIAGLDFAGLLGGAIITEQIFQLPGLGRLTLQAVLQDYDLPIIVATTTLAAAFVVIANLIVDLAYELLDPRIRIS